MRRAVSGLVDEEASSDEEEVSENATISPDRYAEMSAAENLILTIRREEQVSFLRAMIIL